LRLLLDEQEILASQLPFSEDVSTEAEDIIGIRYHAVTDEDISTENTLFVL
jgi:hypothetical protein